MSFHQINIVEELKTVINGAFNYLAFSQFCAIWKDEFTLPPEKQFNTLLPVNGTVEQHITAFILVLKEHHQLGRFIDLLVAQKGLPDMVQLQSRWNQLFERDAVGLDQFRQEAFDLIFFRDNNEDYPFINREVFKNHIRMAINTRPQSSLRLLVNGRKGVGISYLKEYLTHLDIHYKCLKKYIIIDCNEDLLKEVNEEVHPVHLAESLLNKLDIETPTYIDIDDPTKFKERYYSRFFDEIKKKCEEDDEAIVLFIDHLNHEMHPEVFRFFDKFLEKLKQFRVPYMLILGGLTADNITLSAAVKEITLEPFKKQDLSDFFAKIYRHLKFEYPLLMEPIPNDEFINQAIEVFEEDLQDEQGAPVEETQRKVKLWYEELLKQITIQGG